MDLVLKSSPNYINKFLAVLLLLFGACDRISPATGPLVTRVKVGVLKNVVTALVKPETTVFDWRIMALQVLCYFTMQRFSDLKSVKDEDIRVLANGDLRIFQRVGKTLQMGQENYFLSKTVGGFTVKSLMEEYVLKLGLKSCDFLFP